MDAKEFNKLLKKICGDDNAFEIIYKFYFSRVVRYLSVKYNSVLAEDATQEFFINLKSLAERYEYIEQPTAWVYKCCENNAKNKVRQNKRYTYIEELDELVFEQRYEEEIYGDLYEAIKRLDSSSQKLIRMHYFEGYSHLEIAQIMNENYSAIRKKHSRTLKKLKKLLKDVTN